MLRSVKYVLAAGLSALVIVGCGAEPPQPNVRVAPTELDTLGSVGLTPFVVNYGGSPLNCMRSHWGSERSSYGGISCDWGRWKGEHPPQTNIGGEPLPVLPENPFYFGASRG